VATATARLPHPSQKGALATTLSVRVLPRELAPPRAGEVRICLDLRLPRPTDPVHSVGSRCLPRPPIRAHTLCKYRIVHLFAIAYAPWLSQEPRLRTRLTLGRLPWPRNPQACGVAGSHRQLLRYSFRHSHFGSLHGRSPLPLLRYPRTLPYQTGVFTSPVLRRTSSLLPRLRDYP
jgi:hypothetical protein